jgi:hypothetical protein
MEGEEGVIILASATMASATRGGFNAVKTPKLTGVRLVAGGDTGGSRNGKASFFTWRRCRKCSSSIGNIPTIPSLQV